MQSQKPKVDWSAVWKRKTTSTPASNRIDTYRLIVDAYMKGASKEDLLALGSEYVDHTKAMSLYDGQNPPFDWMKSDEVVFFGDLIADEAKSPRMEQAKALLSKALIREDRNFVFVHNEAIGRLLPQVVRLVNIARCSSKIVVVNGQVITYPSNRGEVDQALAVEVATFVAKNLAADARNRAFMQGCKEFFNNVVNKTTSRPATMSVAGNL